MKTIRVKMTDTKTGDIYYWSIEKSNDLTWIKPDKGHYPGHKQISGWSFIDHDGYKRFVEGNWNNLMERFHLVAGNYNLSSNIS